MLTLQQTIFCAKWTTIFNNPKVHFIFFLCNKLRWQYVQTHLNKLQLLYIYIYQWQHFFNLWNYKFVKMISGGFFCCHITMKIFFSFHISFITKIGKTCLLMITTFVTSQNCFKNVDKQSSLQTQKITKHETP